MQNGIYMLNNCCKIYTSHNETTCPCVMLSRIRNKVSVLRHSSSWRPVFIKFSINISDICSMCIFSEIQLLRSRKIIVKFVWWYTYSLLLSPSKWLFCMIESMTRIQEHYNSLLRWLVSLSLRFWTHQQNATAWMLSF